MAATVAATDIGIATILSKKVAAVYVPLVEVTEMTLPDLSRDSVDFTHFGSPDRHREFKPGLSDAGEIGFTYNLVPGLADDAAMAASMASNVVEEWRVTFPNGATLDVKAFGTAHGRAAPMDDKMTGTGTLKISGKPVLVPGV